MELNTKVKFSIENFFHKKIYLFRHGYEKKYNKFKDLKKILNKKDLTVLDSRWFLKEPLRGQGV